MVDENLHVYERIHQLFLHLKLEKVHAAAHQWPGDWEDLASNNSQLLGSLTLAGGLPPNTSVLENFARPLFLFYGEGGPDNWEIESVINSFADVRSLKLSGYSRELWDDIVADRTDEIVLAWEAFLEYANAELPVPKAACEQGEGEHAGIRYMVRGSGPGLVLFPLGLAKSQWEPLAQRLSERYCTITVSGSHLGPAAVLEGRARSSGYLDVVDKVVEVARLRPGERVLEVGCGTGAISRFMASNHGKCLFTGVDVNSYLLTEATALTNSDAIDFKEGNAESLPFADASFDAALSFTVLEELDVEEALEEMVRVVKPGGRIGVLVRSMDTHVVVNLPLRAEILQKVEAPPRWWGGVGEKGCADRSLYRRFTEAGLENVRMLPQLAIYIDRERLEGLYPQFAALLDDDEVEEWWAAVEAATEARTAFIAQPMHSAAGVKPQERT